MARPKNDPLAASSKIMFGNEARLRVAAAIHHAASNGEPVSAIDLEDATGLRYNPVFTDVKRLVAGGLLSETETGPGGRQFYEVHDSPYWEACAQLLKALGD